VTVRVTAAEETKAHKNKRTKEQRQQKQLNKLERKEKQKYHQRNAKTGVNAKIPKVGMARTENPSGKRLGM